MESTHYRVDGTLIEIQKTMVTTRFALITGTGFNITRGEALPPEWETDVVTEAEIPRLSEANFNPLTFGKSVWVTVSFGNTLFRVRVFACQKDLGVERYRGVLYKSAHHLYRMCRSEGEAAHGSNYQCEKESQTNSPR